MKISKEKNGGPGLKGIGVFIAAAFVALLAVFFLADFGANRQPLWTALSIPLFFMAFLILGSELFQPAEKKATDSLFSACLILMGIVVFWSVYQTLPPPFVPESWLNPGYDVVNMQHSAISIAPDRSESFLLRLMLYVTSCWAAYRLSRDEPTARTILLGIGWVIWALCINFIVERATGFAVLSRLAQPLNMNHFATVAGTGVLLSLGLMHKQLEYIIGESWPTFRETVRVWMVVLFDRALVPLIGVLISVTALYLTDSRGAIAATNLAMIAMGAFYLVTRPGSGPINIKRAGIKLAVSALVLAALLYPGIVYVLNLSRTEATFGLRAPLFEQAFILVQDNAWFGTGLATFREAFRPYKPPELVGFTIDYAHNMYLENLAELGVPVAALLFLAIGLIGVRLVQGVRFRRRNRHYPLIGVSVLVLVGVHSAVDFALAIPAIGVLVWALIGCCAAQALPSRRRRRVIPVPGAAEPDGPSSENSLSGLTQPSE